jgi:Holliday junction resolvase RusA-like endonuclease
MQKLPSLGEEIFRMNAEIKALSKERPRTGKGGHFFTPKRTREYERQIREAAEVFVQRAPVDFPIALEVSIFHKVPKSWHADQIMWALEGKIFPSRGDLDNKVKAISDALNGIVFVDDVQVVRLNAAAFFGRTELVCVKATRAGYTLQELRASSAGHNESSARMGGRRDTSISVR